MEAEDDAVPISALQHWLFCARQCALIHLEQQWAENRATMEGKLAHERVHDAGTDRRGGIRIARAVPLRSDAHGLVGVADVVEWHGPDPVPVEHKRGRPKSHRADEVQLCAQALCLEAMTGRPVPRGFLFYGVTRRRAEVAFDDELRALTLRIAGEVQTMFRSRATPPAVHNPKKCDACSLVDACRPRAFDRKRDVARWLTARIEEPATP